MRRYISILILLVFISQAYALRYSQQDWTNNGNCALMFDDVNAPFDVNCIVALGNASHDDYRTATVVSPNFVLSCRHWHVSPGCRIKKMGNTDLFLGKDGNGVAQYSDIYIVSDRRDSTYPYPDFTLYRIKKAIDPDDPDIPEPGDDYDWINDPCDYFEDADLTSYVNLYKKSDELDKELVIAGFGPHRIYEVHDPIDEYAVAPGILHWGYNRVSDAPTGGLYIEYDPGTIANEVFAGDKDSGSGWYIYDEEEEAYKIAATFFYPNYGPRISAYIDDIAQCVSAMGTPTLADRVLGGLEQDVDVSYQIENDADELNPVDPDTNELTLTVTVDNLYEFAANGAGLLTIYVDVPDAFEDNCMPFDFTYDLWNDTYYCQIDLGQIDPCSPVSKSMTMQVNSMAEPMGTVTIGVTTEIDDLIRTSDAVSCDVANWSDPYSVAGVIYVNAAAAVSTSGTSWAYPYKTLQDAIVRAVKPGSGISEIWLSAGTYTADEGESFAIDKDIEIYGGFVGSESDPDQRSHVANKTIITVPDPLQTVFWMSSEGAIRHYLLDGLTITGSAQSGIYLRRNTLDVQHCVVSGNGAGIAGNNTTLIIQDSVFTYNEIGLDMSYSGIAVDQCVFSFNEDIGVKSNTNGVFIGNSVISENLSDGLNFTSPNTTEILNCTIVNNGGYGLYGLSGAATTRINNSIVYGNSNDTIPTGQYIGNNVQSDPDFWFPYVENSDYVRYQLSPDSVNCIDSGATALVYYYPVDLYGQDRVINSTVDIGAVEFLPISDCDFNVDGVVNSMDYSEFTGFWGLDSNDPEYDVKYDFDTDGNIDIDDLAVFAENWLYGVVSTGTVTSTYQVDFGYRVPEIGMMMMSMPTYEPEWTFLEENVISSTFLMDSISVDNRLDTAKSRLDISELAMHETSVPSIVPMINRIQQERQERRQQIENLPVLLEILDEMWLNGEFDETMTEEEYIEFRRAFEAIYY